MQKKKLWRLAGGWNSGGYAAEGVGHRRSYERHALATRGLPSEQRPELEYSCNHG